MENLSYSTRATRLEASGTTSLQEARAVDHTLAPYGILLLRLALGVDWLAHAFLKTSRGMETHAALLARNGITPLLAWPTFGLEVLGGIAILLGFYSRQWALLLLVFLSVVVWVKWPVGWLYSYAGGGWEYPLFWLAAQAGFVLSGDGAFALKTAPLLPRFLRG
jgi:putative oxidoreductase